MSIVPVVSLISSFLQFAASVEAGGVSNTLHLVTAVRNTALVDAWKYVGGPQVGRHVWLTVSHQALCTMFASVESETY